MRQNLCFIYWFLEYILCKLEKEIKSFGSPLLLDPWNTYHLLRFVLVTRLLALRLYQEFL